MPTGMQVQHCGHLHQRQEEPAVCYENNDYFRNDGKIVLGSDYANLYLYGLRVYDSALPSEAVQKNYINQLVTTDEKLAEKNVNLVLDGEGVNIDFNATKLLYNVFVVDKPFPNLMNPSGVAGNLEVFFKDKPERNFTLTNLLVEGQYIFQKIPGVEC